MKSLKSFLNVIVVTTFILSCNNRPNYPTPPGYDLNHPTTVRLPTQLDEISGIIYYPKDTGVFAISDATGSLYKIFPDRNTTVQKWKFGDNEDYEDVQLVDSVFYVLSSKGNLVSIRFSGHDSLQTSSFKFPDKKNEFESLYYDSSLRKLVLICKDCHDDKKNSVSSWSFDIDHQAFDKGPVTIDVDKIADDLNLKDVNFKPSGAAINPLTHELFIISSVNKALVITDMNGHFKKVYPLSSRLYKQPEGIAFTPKGDLLISNESSDEGSANIQVIKYKKIAQ
ncbi:MAG TPA: SdiA-regulated domain-containing protein [Parafilimonas sp.]|nr:SdiA-regulated domain-containing protein [Parafilimonas sp.]